MAGSFAARTRELGAQVGRGKLEGKVEVDQIYAASQHEGGWVSGPNAGVRIVNHPRGGGPRFLSEPLMEKGRAAYMQRLADRILDPGGPVSAMAENMEDLCDEVGRRAPVEFEDLRRSGHPTVMSDGRIVYDRPPEVPRLENAALKVKKRLSASTDIPAQLGDVRRAAHEQAIRHAERPVRA